MQGEARLPVAYFSTGRHAMGVGDRRNGNSTSRDRRVALDIARWRGDHAGASRRGSCRALQWWGRSKSASVVDMNYRRLLKRNNREGSVPAVDVDDGWSQEDRCRGCLHRGRLLMDRGRRGTPCTQPVAPEWTVLPAPVPWTPACLRVPEAPAGRGQQRLVYLQEEDTLE